MYIRPLSFSVILLVAVHLYGQTFSFEDSFEGWEINGDMPTFPCTPGQTAYPECQPTSQILQRLWLIRRSNEQAQDGSHSLKITMDGESDDGTAWIVRSFPVQPNSTYHVDLGFYLGLLNGSAINTWSVVAYAGTKRPTLEADFTRIGDTGAGVGWTPFSYSADIDAGDASELWLAVGIRVNWETWLTFYLDHITVNIAPQAPSGVIGGAARRASRHLR
jgi:hypothetical protein